MRPHEACNKIRSKKGQPARLVFVLLARRFSLSCSNRLQGPLPSPLFDLPIIDEPLKRFDRVSGITLWMFWMTGKAVADLYKASTVRIFHRNIEAISGWATTQLTRQCSKPLTSAPSTPCI